MTANDLAPRLRRELAERNAEIQRLRADLAAMTQELEGFSYAVSHDLRAPLRAVLGFSQILTEECAAELSADARHYLDLVAENAAQLAQLIDALLAYSRVARAPLVPEPLDPAAVAREALARLRLAESPARIVVPDLPPCVADASLLRLAFEHLLQNAVKFSQPREAPLVEVGARVEGAETVYFVRDNGVGFDMGRATKLFGVFQRLHAPRDFEGVGIGLAIVQRIIHRHGGRIWAESEPGVGATFSFTLEGLP